jgi:MFS family permease
MLGFSVVLTDDQMIAWGWRLPFLVAAPLGLVGFYLRTRLQETPLFRELAESGNKETNTFTQFKDLLVDCRGPILRLGGPGGRAQCGELHAAYVHADVSEERDRLVE